MFLKELKLFLVALFLGLNSQAQHVGFREGLNKESLFRACAEIFPEDIKIDYIKSYQDADEAGKDFMLLMISLPRSSKKDLIENYENKKAEIEKLKQEYSKLIPEDYVVEIEFEPESKILTVPEQISINIYSLSIEDSDLTGEPIQKYTTISQNRDLLPNSEELDTVLKSLAWSRETLARIKSLLDEANCISIENGEITTIGFARSGMGMYSYKLFDKPLNQQQEERYDDRCQYIYYKDHVVLEYGSGAFGQECFERE
ncbi:hypothetical protein [Sphingobacterium hungaricum]